MVAPLLAPANFQPSSDGSQPSDLSLLKRSNTVVIGCGLGRDADAQVAAFSALSQLLSRDIPVVVDGDGIYMFCQFSKRFQQNSINCKLILTPNYNELRLLWRTFLPDVEFEEVEFDRDSLQWLQDVRAQNLCTSGTFNSPTPFRSLSAQTVRLARTMSEVLKSPITIVRKAIVDVIVFVDGQHHSSELVLTQNTSRRCGGQGDMLAGLCAYFADRTSNVNLSQPSTLVASTIACHVMRCVATATLLRKSDGRWFPYTTTDMLETLPHWLSAQMPEEQHLSS